MKTEVDKQIDNLKDEFKKRQSDLIDKNLIQEQKSDTWNVSTLSIQNTWIVVLFCFGLTISYICFLHCKILADKRNDTDLQICMTQPNIMSQARETLHDLNEYEEPEELMKGLDLKQMEAVSKY